MEQSTLADRLRFTLKTAQPLRPAYVELKRALWIVGGLLAVCALEDSVQLFIALHR